jgi:hypothetical protein
VGKSWNTVKINQTMAESYNHLVSLPVTIAVLEVVSLAFFLAFVGCQCYRRVKRSKPQKNVNRRHITESLTQSHAGDNISGRASLQNDCQLYFEMVSVRETTTVAQPALVHGVEIDRKSMFADIWFSFNSSNTDPKDEMLGTFKPPAKLGMNVVDQK